MAAADYWDAETCAAALDGAGLGGLFGGTPRRRRGVDWEAAAQRMDYFVSALRDAVPGEAPPPRECAADDAPAASEAVEVTPRRPRQSDAAAACASPVAPRSSWRASEASEAERRKAEAAAADADAAERARRAPAAHAYAQAYVYRGGSGDENEGAVDNDAGFDDFDDEAETLLKRSSSVPVGFYGSDGACSTRERALHAHIAALEAELRRARLAGALREMRAACGDLAGASLAQQAAAGSPGAAPRRRAEAAEAAVAELRAERDAAMARCDALEERLGTAADTIALLRRRLEAAESSGSGSHTSYTPAPPAPAPPASARVRDAVAAAVAAAESLPSAQRRRRLRALRLRWHPDKHGGDALSALATEVTQALNEQIEAMQRRAALRGSDDDASDG